LKYKETVNLESVPVSLLVATTEHLATAGRGKGVNHYILKTDGEVDVQIYLFLTSNLEVKWSDPPHGRIHPRWQRLTYPLGRTMGESHSKPGCGVENTNYPSVRRI